MRAGLARAFFCGDSEQEGGGAELGSGNFGVGGGVAGCGKAILDGGGGGTG